jgi:hypothetical protein
METAESQKHWQDLYKLATLEADPTLQAFRIREAQKAIQHRARQLWYDKSAEPNERQALDVASHFLEILRTCVTVGDGDARDFAA